MAEVMTNLNNYIYLLDNKIYVNLTNACSNDCLFCIRSQKDDVQRTNMWLTARPDFETIKKQIETHKDLLFNGVTFCGYGEPLIEYESLLEIAKYLKLNFPKTYIKINTNGHANAIHKKDIVPLLKNYIDEVSISLNAQNEDLYNEISKPKIENAYNEMLDFAKKCVENGIKTTMTVVTNYKNYNIDTDVCKNIAHKIGANFRERPWIKDGY